jgi:SAM-dependent methyltransferase
LIFPDGDLSFVTPLYQDSPGAQLFNTWIQQAVVRAIATLPTQRGLRILELGAGTGGTTSFLLPHLPPDQTQYRFTDVGALFLQKAQERFGAYSFVQYRPLDIEQDPASQGFEPHQQDIIIAANVLHATQDLNQTLAHVRQLLAPGGLLILMEGTRPQGWLDLIFGLLPGWWRFTDRELRPDYPLLDRHQWRQILLDHGFSAVTVLPQTPSGDGTSIEEISTDSVSTNGRTGLGEDLAQDLAQAVILAQASPEVVAETTSGGEATGDGEITGEREAKNPKGTWLILADRQGVGQGIGDRLRHQGESCTVITLELPNFQASANRDLGASLWSKLGVEEIENIENIVHCWGLDVPEAATLDATLDSQTLEQATHGGYGTALGLVQRLLQAEPDQLPRLWLVTRGTQPVSQPDLNLQDNLRDNPRDNPRDMGQVNLGQVNLSQTTLWGLGKGIALEQPGLCCTCIDLDAEASLEEQAAMLWAELWWAHLNHSPQEHPSLDHPPLNHLSSPIDLSENSGGSGAEPRFHSSLWRSLITKPQETQLALRRQHRYVARLVPHPPGSESSRLDSSRNGRGGFHLNSQSAPLDADGIDGIEPNGIDANGIDPIGTYLITGGLGGLGLLVADWLVGQGAKSLVLVSRHGLGQAPEAVQVQIQALEAKGVEVRVLEADVADPVTIALVLQTIQTTCPPLKGLIHGAGVLADGLLPQQTWQTWQTVMGPKVQGAWNLHRLTQSLDLDFFILFSSAAALLGSIGQANHGAANAFLDGLVHYRQTLGLPGQSLNLGPVTQIGEAAERGADRQAQRWGMEAIAPTR